LGWTLSGWHTISEPLVNEGRAERSLCNEKDPDYALGYAGLADTYVALGSSYGGGHYLKETLPEAKAAATKASELDSFLGEAHFSVAQTMELYDSRLS
jgi:hypothetical protein